MSINQPKSEKLPRIIDEHDHLREVLCDCRKLIRRRDANVDIIVITLDELSSYIESHFNHEEQDGYFEEELELAPQIQRKVITLLSQHPKFLQDLKKIRKYATAGDGSPNWWESLDEQFGDFLKEFFDHEHQENALIQNTYNEDIGAAD